MNEKVRVKKIGQDDKWVSIPEEQRAHVTAIVEWDSFHDHVDADYTYKWVGEHCHRIDRRRDAHGEVAQGAPVTSSIAHATSATPRAAISVHFHHARPTVASYAIG